MMRRITLLLTVFCAAGMLSAPACSDDEGTGTLTVAIWGEEFIEEGIPGEEFEDGWAVTYEKFIVLLHDVTTGTEGGTDIALIVMDGCAAYDLVKPGPVTVSTMEVETGTYLETAYAIKPGTPACTSAQATGTADAADLAMMLDKGYAVYVEGKATKDGQEIAFAWGFGKTITYSHCHSSAKVADGGQAEIELTIHGDHLFYNSLTNPEAGLAFQALADADADGDGAVTTQELNAVSADAFKALDNYDVGSLPVDDLYGYLEAQSATLGHIDGEGHCDIIE